MAVIETWFEQDLQMPVKVRYIDGNLFSHNGNGNRIGVIVTNNGEPVTLTGSVSGYAVLADGTTVPCTGTRSGNKASILVPAAAYSPGSILISIFLTDGTTVTTLAALSSSVIMARTGNQISPGSVVTDWTNTINAAMQSVETAAANLGNIVATPYANLTFPVPLGKYTIYNNSLYRCISPIASSEAWTAEHWTNVKLGDDVADLKSAINYVRKVTTETIIPDWHLGTISSANGKESSSTNNIITARLKCYAGTSISIGTGDGYVMVAKYSLIDGSYIGVLGGWAKAYTLDEDCYCKFLAKNETSSTISDISEVVAKVNFDVYSENVLLPDVKESKENIAVISDYFVVGTNLFDLSTIVDGILAPTNGNITQSSLYFVSDYIPVEINKTYTYQTDTSFGSTTMKRIAVYDSSKTYIGYFQGTVTNEVNVFTVSLSAVGNTVSSSDIKYVRICNIKTKLSGQQYCEGDTLPRYEPYGAKYLESDFRLNETQKQEVQQYISSPLAGKKILYNGDSICESRTNESSLDYNGGAYAKMISDLTGSTYINYAIGGATLVSAVPSGANVQRRLSRDIQYMDDTADLICFDGGINDYSYSVPMGTFSESDYTSELDTTTLCGAMESVIRQSMAKWVGKPICFVLTHKMYNTVYTENNAGYTFAEAHEKLKQICKKYSIPVYDAYEDSGLNGYVYIQRVTFLNASPTGQADGWHPNAAGYKAYYVNHLLKLFESILVSE